MEPPIRCLGYQEEVVHDIRGRGSLKILQITYMEREIVIMKVWKERKERKRERKREIEKEIVRERKR